MIKNILITGLPGAGKTSLIIEILKELNLNVGGFYTQEIRKGGQRLGFKIITLDGREGILAHINIKSPHRVSRYKVNIKDLEEIVVGSILDSLNKNKFIIIDEVGKMELFSEKFKKAVLAALDSKNKVLGTIKLIPDPFTDGIKRRGDTKIFHLTRDYNPPTASSRSLRSRAPNRGEIKKEIKNFLAQ